MNTRNPDDGSFLRSKQTGPIRLSGHLYLTGYRGTGKSSVAVLLAKSLGRPVIDLDLVIEANRGRSIREIFDEGGESLFRDLESEALQTIAQEPLIPKPKTTKPETPNSETPKSKTPKSQTEPLSAVVALGGGAILREVNREVIAATGTCVWLDADAATILQRIRGDASSTDRRPALTDLPALEEIDRLLRDRKACYQQAAKLKIDTVNKEPAEVAAKIIAELTG